MPSLKKVIDDLFDEKNRPIAEIIEIKPEERERVVNKAIEWVAQFCEKGDKK